MSDKMTSIRLPHMDGGIAEYGHAYTRAEMIKVYRDHAMYEKRRAEMILEAKDEEFIVEQYVGKIVERNKRRLDP
jgi:hypothetical protein